jgi:hypothetical protein
VKKMPKYHSFTSARPTEPDALSLRVALRTIDPTADVQHQSGQPTYVVKKAGEVEWTEPQITSAQNVIDTVAASTPQLTAQAEIDTWPIAQKAFALALIDQLNVIRAALPTPKPDITPAQAIAAIRAKAGTL